MTDDAVPRPEFLPPGFGTVGHRDFVEIMVPPPVTFEPRTTGWYVLFALAVVAFALLLFRTWSRYRKNAYRRAALRELAQLRRDVAADPLTALPRLPVLLKRCALAAFPRDQVAGLSGAEWSSFLERTAPGALDETAQKGLLDLVVHSAQRLPREQDVLLLDAVERWMRQHHV